MNETKRYVGIITDSGYYHEPKDLMIAYNEHVLHSSFTCQFDAPDEAMANMIAKGHFFDADYSRDDTVWIVFESYED